MTTVGTANEFWTKYGLLEPDGPVCLIVQAQMGVAAGLDRFQPAGFPEVGHVIYDAPRSNGHTEKICIVDSPASMANHLEQVCLASETDPNLHPDLTGLPYVKCMTDRKLSDDPRDPKKSSPDLLITTSLTEGHRIASDYFVHPKDKPTVVGGEHGGKYFRQVLRDQFGIIPVKEEATYFIPPEAWWTIYATLFKYDPNSLVRGVLFAREQIKISRMLTAHLEAFGAARVGRSGVKFDRLQKTTSGQPIFAVDEETAREIRATFIIDLALLRSYGQGKGEEARGLNEKQKELLLGFALWKIQKLLGKTFSYRSGCKLQVRKVQVTTDEQKEGDDLPLTALPAVDIASAVKSAKFPSDPVTRVYYPHEALFKPGKEDKKSGDEEGDEEADENESGD